MEEDIIYHCHDKELAGLTILHARSRLVEPASTSVGAVHESREEYGEKKRD